MGCLPCFGSAGEGAAKEGGARKDGTSDLRVTRVESGGVPWNLERAGSWMRLW
jgi:hypothetical protein